MSRVLLFAILLLGRLAVAAEKGGSEPRVLVDFRKPDSVKLRPDEAKTERLADAAGSGLTITTDAGAAYPGVYIEPSGGKWDLTAFDGVEMDVRNPQSVAVRVLLCINNPGANGRDHCNVESVTVPPRGKSLVCRSIGQNITLFSYLRSTFAPRKSFQAILATPIDTH